MNGRLQIHLFSKYLFSLKWSVHNCQSVFLLMVMPTGLRDRCRLQTADLQTADQKLQTSLKYDKLQYEILLYIIIDMIIIQDGCHM